MWPRHLRAAFTALTASVLLAGMGAAGVAWRPASARADNIRDAQLPVLRAIGAQRAWQVSTGRGVTVAVLDSGVDGGVPDLAGSVTTGPDYTAGADPAGYHPPRQHGTYIASLIAGHGSGPERADGVVGVAPRARILSIRVLLEESEPGFLPFNENPRYADTVADGIRYAVRHGARVINMSLGGPRPTRGEEQAIGEAIAHGVVLVAAAGNDGTATHRFTRLFYPASVPGVIAVAAVTAGGRHVSFSDHNASVVVSAPGVGVVGAGPGGTYLDGEGTSQASALVAGIAALIRARYPALPPAFVAHAIIAGTTHRPPGGYSVYTGFGEVNAAGALRAAGRLSVHARSAHGLNPATSVGGAAARAPVRIIYHDRARLASWGAAGVAGALGFIGALAALAMLIRRTVRRRAPAEPAVQPGARGSAVRW